MALRLRDLTTEERATIERLTRSRTAPARLVERARLVWHASQGARAPAIAARLGLDGATVRRWLRRFNAGGVAGLADAPRSGRPATYTPEEIGGVLATSLTDPPTLGLPFGCWTLDRLEASRNEAPGI